MIQVLTFIHCSVQVNKLDLDMPFIGTGGYGPIFPGATAPYGMGQLRRDTGCNGWDADAGFSYMLSTRRPVDFSLTHLSGTGIGDCGGAV